MPVKGRGQSTRRSSSDVRDRLLAAGERVLVESGFLGASARTIAQEAGVAPGSIHYYFDSVDDLLLASLQSATTRRLADYEALAQAKPLANVLEGLATELAADQASGRFRLLAQMLSAALGNPRIAAVVAEETGRWQALAEQAIEASLPPPLLEAIPARDLAHGLIAFVIGLEMLDSLGPDGPSATDLIERIGAVGSLLGLSP